MLFCSLLLGKCCLILSLFFLLDDMQYPENRYLPPEAQKEIFDHLAFKVKVSDIKGYIESKYGITLKDYDIHNRRRDLKTQQTGGLSAEELLATLINEILDNDKGATCDIVVNQENEAQVIFLQTSEMRTLLKKYPTITFIDTTYKTNDRSMPLFSIMVPDANKNGQVVGHALILNEQAENLKIVLQKFKEVSNIERDEVDIKTVIIDKDFSELKAIKDIFPDTNIIICKFHIKQAFDRKIKHFGEAVRDKAMTLMEKMCLSQTEHQYDEYVEEMCKECPQVAPYFLKNWHSCREHWVGFLVKNYETRGNLTNNIIESNHRRIKLHVDKNTSVPQLLKKLVGLSKEQTTKRNLIKSKLRLTKKVIHLQDVNIQPYLEEIHTTATPRVAKELEKELKLSQNQIYHFLNNRVTDSQGIDYIANENTCSCYLSRYKKVICRHVFFYRGFHNLPIFRAADVPKMNQLTYYFDVDPEQNPVPNTCTVEFQSLQRRLTLSRNEKFRKAQKLLNQICDEIANENVMQDFEQHISIFENILKCIRQRKKICFFTDEDVISSEIIDLSYAASSHPPEPAPSDQPEQASSNPHALASSTPTETTTFHPPVSASTRPPVPSYLHPTVSVSNRPPVLSSSNPYVSASNIPPVPSSSHPPVSEYTRPPVPSSSNPYVSVTTRPPVPSSTNPSVSASTRPPVPSSFNPSVLDSSRQSEATSSNFIPPAFTLPCRVKKSPGGSRLSLTGKRGKGRPPGTTKRLLNAKRRRIVADDDLQTKQFNFLINILKETSFISQVLGSSLLVDEYMVKDLEDVGNVDNKTVDLCAEYFTAACLGKIYSQLRNLQS